MKDLLIGSTSQLAYYWPKENVKIISSRNVDVEEIKKQKWNRIYLSFSDGRTYLTENINRRDFHETNVVYTLWLIEHLQGCCENIVFYSTTELWNKHMGPLSLELESGLIIDSFDFFKNSPYINSKAIVTSSLLEKYPNVIILFPYSFNSPIRKEQGFLFSKVFDSILNKKKIKIGNTYYYRDLIHPRFVVRQSVKADKHQIIGSGRLTHVNDFIWDLYKSFGMKYDVYVKEDLNSKVSRGVNWLDSNYCRYSYQELLDDTINALNDCFRRRKAILK